MKYLSVGCPWNRFSDAFTFAWSGVRRSLCLGAACTEVYLRTLLKSLCSVSSSSRHVLRCVCKHLVNWSLHLKNIEVSAKLSWFGDPSVMRKTVLVKKGGKGEGHRPFSWFRYLNIVCVSSTNAFGLGRNFFLVENVYVYLVKDLIGFSSG